MSRQVEADITFYGVPLRVSGEYVPRRPAKITADPYYSHPGEGGEFLIDRVMVDEYDIFELMDDEVVVELATKLFERYEDE